MTKYLISRTLQAIIVLFGVTLVTFILVNVVPGDPVLLMLDKRADPQTIARIRTELGFDKPYYEQYLSFLGQAIRGDLGQSYFEKTPVTDMIVRSLAYGEGRLLSFCSSAGGGSMRRALPRRQA